MKRTLLTVFALIVVGLGGLETSTRAQDPDHATGTKMIYHDGEVVTVTPNVYMIWYGCWTGECGNPDGFIDQLILTDLVSNLSSSPYFEINSTYQNGSGVAPNGRLHYGLSEADPSYSFGVELTDADIQGIVRDRISAGILPLDPSGIYIVLASPDVSSTATGFCTAVGTPPHHGSDEFFFVRYKYGFVGDPSRCPDLESPQFVSSDGTVRPTPNDNLTADAMATKLAHVLSTIVTNPYGDGWYDRFGLENADKCQGTFGETYITENGARANIRLWQRDYLLQQNWLNDQRGNRCALSR
jgi:hypothetical protein